ncbi:hypothetical protein [Methanosphaerula palustris]|uniref:Uncharacterized protein n=1 Tax=Methanosphaerula palustris (strain ATCC BAA-1556 / DSM 19958 / E1-9c) TaxID=521011 RepID=B8GFY7_METPE|nr:hypothetical protein [Methanosphaerula palustris]ACL18020.1 conserved hypothetical protein [Methanosphaerula palustris E1-9c]
MADQIPENIETTLTVIEQGFNRLSDLVVESGDLIEVKGAEVRAREGALLGRMGVRAASLIPAIGLNVLERGKIGLDGEVFDARHYAQKVLVLGRTDPMPFRPDNPEKKIDDQFCVLREDGTFAELMYSSAGGIADSYLQTITPDEALAIYGYELLFMLYRALKENLDGEETLVAALNVVLSFLNDQTKI